jgi:hypothetical protein
MAIARFLFGRGIPEPTVDFKFDHVERLARARERYDSERAFRPMPLISVAQGRIPAAGSVVGMRRGVRPVLDPAVLARIGEISVDELPAFIRSRIGA